MSKLGATLKVAAETILFSTVGSIFLIALGQQVVETYASGAWKIASGTDTFVHFFIQTAMLYLLYRFVQWILGIIAKKTAQTVDSNLSDVKSYTNVRDRVANVFVQDKTNAAPAGPQPAPSPTPVPGPAPNPAPGQAPAENMERCPSCGIRAGRVHLSGCTINKA